MISKQPEYIFCTYPFMGMLCGVETAKCGVKELTFLQNWTSMLKGSKENVLKMMIIFQNQCIFQSIYYMFLFCFLGPHSRTLMSISQVLECEKLNYEAMYLLTLICVHKGGQFLMSSTLCQDFQALKSVLCSAKVLNKTVGTSYSSPGKIDMRQIKPN